MGLNLQLEDNVLSKIQLNNQKVQLQVLAEKIENLDVKDRFLADTLYTKLYNETFKQENYDKVDDIDIESVLHKFPMYAIQTASSYDSDVLKLYKNRLKDNLAFTGHISVKLNGWHIRVVYKHGEFYKALNKSGRDLTNQLIPSLERTNCLIVEDFEGLPYVEVRGELVINKANLEKVQQATSSTVSSYTGVGLLCDTEDENVWNYLDFVAFDIISDGVRFGSKTEEYQYLEELGFEVPMYWVIEDMQKDSFIEDLPDIVKDCEIEVRATDVQEGYAYLTDGLIFTLDDRRYFEDMGKSLSKYQYGNITLRIGYWKQDTYKGYIQTIYWKQEQNKKMPYAVIADSPNVIEFDDFGINPYITSLDVITNINRLGIRTQNQNVLLVPLYNPNQILRLDAYVNTELVFIDDKVLGVLPCFEDGRVLLDGILQQVIKGEYSFK